MSSIDLSEAPWRKSSYSNGQANCVETAGVGPGGYFVVVRDSKAPAPGPDLRAFGVAPASRHRVKAARQIAVGHRGPPELAFAGRLPAEPVSQCPVVTRVRRMLRGRDGMTLP